MRLAILLSVLLFACGAGMTGYDASRYRNDDDSPSANLDPDVASIPRGAKRWMIDPKQPLDAGAD